MNSMLVFVCIIFEGAEHVYPTRILTGVFLSCFCFLYVHLVTTTTEAEAPVDGPDGS